MRKHNQTIDKSQAMRAIHLDNEPNDSTRPNDNDAILSQAEIEALLKEMPKTNDTFDELVEETDKPHSDFIMDIPVTLSIEMDRTQITIRDLLQLSKGSVLALDRKMGEPFDIFINQQFIARGEMIVIGDNVGLKLCEVVGPSDRIKQLRGSRHD